MTKHILAIDQGTTSSRAMVFTERGEATASHQIAFKQYFPEDGWVEHDPEEIWSTVVNSCKQAILHAKISATNISAIGISNQRETTIIWDKKTGNPIYNAIVWQDRRTFDACKKLENHIDKKRLQEKTGLLLDPYFSATKIAWILDHVEGARARAENGELCFGTIDTFLLWRLTAGKIHATCATNASRTLLFNLQTQNWDDSLLSLFNIPKQLLPEVHDNTHQFGITDKSILDAEIPITGIAGDQQAATIGQACFSPGMMKSTYGTGCFMLLNTGEKPVYSKHQLLTTIVYRINGVVTYGIEGSIFIAGAGIQWLRDGLHIIDHAQDSDKLARSVSDNGGVYLVPAFTGLGAPYWDPKARGALLGLTRDSNRGHVVRATLEAVCYQTRDLMDAMIADGSPAPQTLRVDGGMVQNNWLLEFLAGILGTRVVRAACIETSALGAAYLAGLGAGIYHSLEDISRLWKGSGSYEPTMTHKDRDSLYQGWKKAVSRVLS